MFFLNKLLGLHVISDQKKGIVTLLAEDVGKNEV
jgi:hypothetical protein